MCNSWLPGYLLWAWGNGLALPRKDAVPVMGSTCMAGPTPGSHPAFAPVRGLWGGPFLYNEDRCQGGPSHGQGSLLLPTNLEAPWPPGSPASLCPAVSISLATSPGPWGPAPRPKPACTWGWHPATPAAWELLLPPAKLDLSQVSAPGGPRRGLRCAVGRREVGPEHRSWAGPQGAAAWRMAVSPVPREPSSTVSMLRFYLVHMVHRGLPCPR